MPVQLCPLHLYYLYMSIHISWIVCKRLISNKRSVESHEETRTELSCVSVSHMCTHSSGVWPMWPSGHLWEHRTVLLMQRWLRLDMGVLLQCSPLCLWEDYPFWPFGRRSTYTSTTTSCRTLYNLYFTAFCFPTSALLHLSVGIHFYCQYITCFCC